MQYPKYLRRKVPALVIATFLALTGKAAICENSITLQLNAPEHSPNVQSSGTAVTVGPKSASIFKQPTVNGASAVLMDMDTGQMLYAKNPNVQRPNASTTKIMTAILILEHCRMDDIITASKNAANTPFTSLHLKPGEKITVKDLLYGMLIRSANDAAVAAAEHISGNVSQFSVLMNKKAAEIGCKNTHFVTPNGLYDPAHYSSAYDLCLIARYALGNPIFNDAVNTRKYFLNSRTINKKDLAVYALSKFMKHYPGADGVKSGYIRQAGHCYVGSATRNGWRLVSAVLKSGNAGADTSAMMDYGFNNFEQVMVAQTHQQYSKAKVLGGDADAVTLATAHALRVVVPKTGAKVATRLIVNPLQAPITKGAVVGKLVATVDGENVASVNLRAADAVGISLARRAWAWAKLCGIFAICLVVGGKYGTAFTKNSRLRRRRVAPFQRDYNRWR